jgi:5-(carboxyamino)imidazole ribonucleotide mutase
MAVSDEALAKKLEKFRTEQTEKARSMNLPGHS